jgi:hypothetical protein
MIGPKNKLVLPRRSFLRGALGGVATALALPTLDAMLDGNGVAYAQTGQALPKRLGVWFWGNGVRLDRWNPTGTGASWQLSPELAPLEGVKPYLNVVSGYRAQAGYGRRGHHDGCAAILSGHPFLELPHPNSNYSSKFGGPTIDQVAVDHIAGDTVFPSLHVGISKSVVRGEGPTLEHISHRGPDAPIAAERNPQILFNRLFGSFTPPDATDPTPAMRGRMLDAVKDDARALMRKLGATDRMRLDAHLTAIEQVQREIAAIPPELTSACQVPDRPTETNANVNGQEPLESVNRVMSELIAIAFACDLTRVASVMFSGSVGGTVYHMVGATRGQHELSHEPSEQETIHRTVHWTMRQFAVLLERLRDTPEGDGNLLDRCVWLASTDCSEGLTHSSDDYPIVVAGRAGGFLRYPGVHHRGSRTNNTSDVLLSVLRAAGADVTEVGEAQGYSRNPCAPIEA